MPNPREILLPNHPTMRNSLPDAFLADGLVIFGGPVGGLFSMGFEIEMPNLQSSSCEQCNRVQDGISTVLRQLPENMKMQVIQLQTPMDIGRLMTYQKQTLSCANDTTRMLRNANFIQTWKLREAGELLSKRVFIYFSQRAPTRPKAGGKSGRAEELYEVVLAAARTSFKECEQSLVQALIPIGARDTVLTDAQNARLWFDTLNPSLARHPHHDAANHFDPNRSLLDNFWNSEIRGLGRQGFILDGYHHLAITVRRLPSETYPTIVHRLSYLPFSNFNITVHLSRLPKEQVVKRTEFSLNRLNQQIIRKPNERQSVTAEQMKEKIRRLATGEAVPMEMELIILLHAKTPEELGDKAAAIKNTLQGTGGMQYYEATLPATSRELFAKTLPGWMGSRHQGFKLYCEDRSAADLLPLCNSFSGHPAPVQSLFTGNDNNLVNVVMFVGEGESSTPQSMVVLGGTGAGKSLALNKLLIETDDHFAHTAIVEEGMSQAPYIRSHGIEPVIFRTDGTQTLNPFDTQGAPLTSSAATTQTAIVSSMLGLRNDDEKSPRKSALISRQLGRLCEEHAEQQLRNSPMKKRSQIVRHAMVLDQLARERAIDEPEAFAAFNKLRGEAPAEADKLLGQFSQSQMDEFESVKKQAVVHLLFAYLAPDEHLTLSSLREHLELADQDEEECRWLATLLAPWCRDGNYGSLFDGASNVVVNGPVVHYELGFISKAAEKIKGVVGLMIINSIRNHVLAMPRALKKRVIIEELSRFLDIPGGVEIVRELFEQFRKFNVQVIIVAQQYSRIADTPIRAAIMGNTRAWLIFNTGDRRDVERLCDDLGLSKVACESILRQPRPDQQTGSKYSEFLYYHTSDRQPICGTVRYVLLPHQIPVSNKIPTSSNHE